MKEISEQTFAADSISKAIKGYLGAVKGGPQHDDALPALAKALDGIAVAYHTVPAAQQSDTAIDPPAHGYKRQAELISAAFPQMGFYSDLDPTELEDPQITLGDAIDDLADIAVELGDVLWHLENSHIEDALWTFRFGYERYWGKHLHDVRRYIYAISHRI